ncbi:PEPxxWA-CTERM sorting domain-containing protein [Sphingomonas flavescens]|uniref:PEPxxWA-CTERM sorting domain-containing protein n=1 Tax=Sphingomonas flavescens TaxID=3132797 RepID=UPI0028048265|nr:PEPxxWA-CTERM sorting domain-containing protein [Sphingomonas limnosediminicola]
MLKNIVCAALLSVATPAWALNIVDTGPGTGEGPSWTLDTSQSLAAQFFTSQDYTVTDEYLWMVSQNAFGLYRASIYSDNGTDRPADLLYSSDFVVGPANTSNWYGVSGQTWNLSTGTYWVVFSAITGYGYTPSGSQSPLGNEASSNNFANIWNPNDSLQLGVIVQGKSGLTGASGAVPEPSSWIMMLVGFGALGMAMRRTHATHLPRLA